jgi:predicted Rossmann-fold nucleotide-binding protein
MTDVAAYDHSQGEIESRRELDHHLAKGRLSGLVVQGLKLDDDPPDLSRADVRGTLFIACRFVGAEVEADLIRRGAQVIPDFHDGLYPTHPSRLYTAGDLAAGFNAGGFQRMYDTRVHRHFVTHGGALPGMREALAQRIHDHGIDDALGDTIDAWTDAAGGPVVGVMGGHAEPRGAAGYRMAARIGQRLAAAGCLVVTGGGPGVMEAANLGAALATADRRDLDRVVEQLAAAPYFTDPEPYTKLALEVLAGLPGERPAPPASGEAALSWARHGGLSVPTWLYGHEPANLFAARIAKYFSNAIREDTILRLARGGVVFAPGRAGTVQEVFQAATKAFYAVDGASGPLIFVDARFWTDTLPVQRLLRPLLAESPHGDLSRGVHLTDDVDEAVALLLRYGPPAAARQAQRTTP